MTRVRFQLAALAILLTSWALLASASASQAPNVADGPWSGQIQCVLSAGGPGYQDEQTHTWRLTGEPPRIAGSVRFWPAVWSVQGKGQRLVSPQTRAASAKSGPSESWTTVVPDTSAPLAMYEYPGTGTFRIHSQHTQVFADAAIQVRASSGETTNSRVWEWTVPSIVADVKKTAISGSSTRTIANGPGWRRPSDVTTTETCTWSLTREAAATLAPAWTGHAQCSLVADAGVEYREQMTHAWTLTGGPRKISGTKETYDATWSVTGEGKNEGLWKSEGFVPFVPSPQKYWSNWKTNVPPTAQQLTFDVGKAGVAVTAAPRLRSAGDAGTGQKAFALTATPPGCEGFKALGTPGCTPKHPEGIWFAVDEWAFPRIESSTPTRRVSGSASSTPTQPISPLQPKSVKPTASCTWDFVRVGG